MAFINDDEVEEVRRVIPEETGAALVLEHTVVAEHLEAVKLDLNHRTAAATASASTVSRVSCTRSIVAPRV